MKRLFFLEIGGSSHVIQKTFCESCAICQEYGRINLFSSRSSMSENWNYCCEKMRKLCYWSSEIMSKQITVGAGDGRKETRDVRNIAGKKWRGLSS